jgi:cell division protein DivIC
MAGAEVFLGKCSVPEKRAGAVWPVLNILIKNRLKKCFRAATIKGRRVIEEETGGIGHMAGRKRRRRSSGTVGITIIVIAFLVVMMVQIVDIKAKDAEYEAKENELLQQYEEETQRSSEIDELETYMNSSEYIEDVAKAKLGLTYKNEIIFKEKED